MSTLLSKEIAAALGNSSMIRKMFEAGNELRKKYGNDKVYDFSLGNPDVPAPAAVKTALQEIPVNLKMLFYLIMFKFPITIMWETLFLATVLIWVQVVLLPM